MTKFLKDLFRFHNATCPICKSHKIKDGMCLASSGISLGITILKKELKKKKIKKDHLYEVFLEDKIISEKKHN